MAEPSVRPSDGAAVTFEVIWGAAREAAGA
jgi:hypothetical protein